MRERGYDAYKAERQGCSKSSLHSRQIICQARPTALHKLAAPCAALAIMDAAIAMHHILQKVSLVGFAVGPAVGALSVVLVGLPLTFVLRAAAVHKTPLALHCIMIKATLVPAVPCTHPKFNTCLVLDACGTC